MFILKNKLNIKSCSKQILVVYVCVRETYFYLLDIRTTLDLIKTSKRKMRLKFSEPTTEN